MNEQRCGKCPKYSPCPNCDPPLDEAPTSEQAARPAEGTTPLSWVCRFHPTDWFHEVGCPHREWTKEELQSAIESNKRKAPELFEQWRISCERLVAEKVADLERRLAAPHPDTVRLAECQKELRSWEYDGDTGQLRAKLSNAAIQSMLDKAKEYMDERDTLLALLRDIKANLFHLAVVPEDVRWKRLDGLMERIDAALAQHPPEGPR
jgi:hypothetical protein